MLSEVQYHNFFRNLAEIVHADGFASAEDKKEFLFGLIAEYDSEDEDDYNNLAEFINWFDGCDF